MITGSEAESRKLMMDAAIRTVAEFGFEGFTTKKWAQAAGVAEGSLYYHFENKNELLSESFYYLDEQMEPYYVSFTEAVLADFLENENTDTISAPESRAADAWRRYYQFLVEHPSEAVFYHRFRTSPRYTEEVRERQILRLMSSPGACEKKIFLKKRQMLLTQVIDLITTMAFRKMTGVFDDSEDAREFLWKLMMYGICGVVGSVISDAPPQGEEHGVRGESAAK